jgi:hypothetical protein
MAHRNARAERRATRESGRAPGPGSDR